MPNVTITIGGRGFAVACQEGEEHYLHSAAALLDAEAKVLSGQIGQLTESRMLLMAGLMLADKVASKGDHDPTKDEEIAQLKAQIAQLKVAPAGDPVRVEVPVVPTEITDHMAELAARAEAIASRVEAISG